MIKLPTDRSGSPLADWLELEILFGDREALSLSEIEGILVDDLGLEEPWIYNPDNDGDQAPPVPDDGREMIQFRIEEALLLIDNRRLRTGDRYPIQVERSRAIRSLSWHEATAFAFMTLLSARVAYQMGQVIPHHEPAKLFERVVKTALKNYLNGHSARFGWPLDGEFAGDIYSRIRTLAALMKERPQRDFHTVSTDGKDHGLDVAAWAPLDDRGSQVVVLCQCGIGADFQEKVLPPTRWPRVINFLATHLTALAIPFEDFGGSSSRTAWDSLAADAGILFDRSRLTQLADIDSEPGLRQEVSNWIDQTMPLLIGE
jgi:hypothetical protein